MPQSAWGIYTRLPGDHLPLGNINYSINWQKIHAKEGVTALLGADLILNHFQNIFKPLKSFPLVWTRCKRHHFQFIQENKDIPRWIITRFSKEMRMKRCSELAPDGTTLRVETPQHPPQIISLGAASSRWQDRNLSYVFDKNKRCNTFLGLLLRMDVFSILLIHFASCSCP